MPLTYHVVAPIGTTGLANIYAIVQSSARLAMIVGSPPTFEAYNSAHWQTYAVALAETLPGVYEATLGAVPDDNYSFEVFQASGTPSTTAATTDNYQGEGGTSPVAPVSVAPTGLDSILTTPANFGVAPNFRQMVVASWRRFFRKHVASGSTLTGYADDGTTVLTTQAMSPALASDQSQGTAA